MAADDALDGGEPEATARRLGREEWVEDARQRLGIVAHHLLLAGDVGIELDEGLNGGADRGARRISAENSPTTVLVIPTDEELAIARASMTVVTRTS